MMEAPVQLARVLIVDDEVGLRDMLSFSLTDRGYSVMSASNGDEAISLVSQHDFDLVVCDIMMPGKNGVEVLAAVKRMKPRTQVIMATGYATMETAAQSIELGAFDYIAKPYGIDQLCGIFEKALQNPTRRILGGDFS